MQLRCSWVFYVEPRQGTRRGLVRLFDLAGHRWREGNGEVRMLVGAQQIERLSTKKVRIPLLNRDDLDNFFEES